MTLEQVFISLITNALCTTTILVTLGFLGRTIIERWVTKDIHKSKIEIEKATSIEIEKIKAMLDAEKFKSEVLFTKFHEKRIEVVNEIHNKLTDLESGLFRVLNQLTDKKAKNQELKFDDELPISLHKTWSYFNKNKIYFNEELANKIEMHLVQAIGISTLFVMSTDLFQLEEWPAQYTEILGQLQDVDKISAAKTLLDELRKDNKEIESEFRKLIGAPQKINLQP